MDFETSSSVARDDQQRKSLLAALARNRGELDAARLAALLELLGAAPKSPNAA